MLGRLNAMWILGFALVKSLFARLVGRPTGISLFAENYREDRLPPITNVERADLPTFSNCIQCARCDVGEGRRIARSRGAFPGLMRLVLASSRSMPDFDAAAKAFSFISDEELIRKESICPTGVPFLKLSRFVKEKGQGSQAVSDASEVIRA